MAKLFNTQALRIEKGEKGKKSEKTLSLPQKRNGKVVYMNTTVEGAEYDWFFSIEEAEALYRHLGGMLGKEV